MADRRPNDYEPRERSMRGDYQRGTGPSGREEYYEGERWAEEMGGRHMQFEEEPRWMGAPYNQNSYPHGANYGQGYASQGGAYGGRRAGGYDWNWGPEYGQESRYGDQWRGRESGFRGSDRGGQQWRTPDYGWRSQYADVGGQGRYQDYGTQRYDPEYERRFAGDQDRWYGEGGWGRQGPSRRWQREGEWEPARMAYDEDYWQDHRPGEYWERHPEYRHGPHAGKGPRGYQRSDQAIQDEACEMLKRHGHIDASDINVSVLNGVVTLSGEVDDRRQKRMAEDVVDDISGVTDVNNQLRAGRRQEMESSSPQKSSSSSQGGERATAQAGNVQNGKTTSSGRK